MTLSPLSAKEPVERSKSLTVAPNSKGRSPGERWSELEALATRTMARGGLASPLYAGNRIAGRCPRTCEVAARPPLVVTTSAVTAAEPELRRDDTGCPGRAFPAPRANRATSGGDSDGRRACPSRDVLCRDAGGRAGAGDCTEGEGGALSA